MNHYSAYRPGPTDRCEMCGEAATVVYVSDYRGPEGYLHEMPLCNTHAAAIDENYRPVEEEYDEVDD